MPSSRPPGVLTSIDGARYGPRDMTAPARPWHDRSDDAASRPSSFGGRLATQSPVMALKFVPPAAAVPVARVARPYAGFARCASQNCFNQSAQAQPLVVRAGGWAPAASSGESRVRFGQPQPLFPARFYDTGARQRGHTCRFTGQREGTLRLEEAHRRDTVGEVSEPATARDCFGGSA